MNPATNSFLPNYNAVQRFRTESHYERLDFTISLTLPMNGGSINIFIHHREVFQMFR
jgi:hypothetical protein